MNTERRASLVVGVGSALVDILLAESEEFVSSLGHARGGMTLVDKSFQDSALGRSNYRPEFVPGGSACNTIVGIGRLGGKTRFVGKCGNDPLGRQLRQGLVAAGVEPLLTIGDTPTGSVLSVVTPDAERTMFTYLGASAEMEPGEVTTQVLEGATIVHVEGYLLFNRDLMMAVISSAQAVGAKVSLDLASYTVVEANLAFLTNEIIPAVDILLANEAEARAYTGHDDDLAALKSLAKQTSTVAVKLGDKGAVVAMDGSTEAVPIAGSEGILDTTGAGDLWASGFLYGLSQEWPLERAGALAAACAYEVCRVLGAQVPVERWQEVRSQHGVESE
ncbi:MAG: adenosine kinase [bacterium]